MTVVTSRRLPALAAGLLLSCAALAQTCLLYTSDAADDLYTV